MARLPNLNVLRFFLAMVVMLGHVGGTSKTLGIPYFTDLPILHKQHLAVYFFFCLSGFLIIRILYVEGRKGRISTFNFYRKRMLRILPLYFIVLFSGVTIYYYLLPHMGIMTGFTNNPVELMKYFIFFLPNVYISQHPQDVGGILYILWSIGVEVQFYLFIPVIFIAFRQNVAKALLALLIVHIIASSFFPSIAGHYFNFYYFLSGGVISILSQEGKLLFLRRTPIKVILSVFFILLFFTNVPVIANDILYYLTTALFASLFICSIADFPLVEIKNKTLNYLGEISYGLYMYHMICITGILYLFNRFQLAQKIEYYALSVILITIAVIASTITLAHFSYRYIETYFIKKKKNTVFFL